MTLEQKWLRLRERMPEHTDPETIELLRLCFYSGACAMFLLVAAEDTDLDALSAEVAAVKLEVWPALGLEGRPM